VVLEVQVVLAELVDLNLLEVQVDQEVEEALSLLQEVLVELVVLVEQEVLVVLSYPEVPEVLEEQEVLEVLLMLLDLTLLQ